MHHLRIPTRKLCLVGNGRDCGRDMFTTSGPKQNRVQWPTRMAPSFLRFGNLNCPQRDGIGFTEGAGGFYANALPLTWVSRVHLPIFALFKAIQARTLALIVDWMRVSFVHECHEYRG